MNAAQLRKWAKLGWLSCNTTFNEHLQQEEGEVPKWAAHLSVNSGDLSCICKSITLPYSNSIAQTLLMAELSFGLPRGF